MSPGGPVFALKSYALAGDSWRRQTDHGTIKGREHLGDTIAIVGLIQYFYFRKALRQPVEPVAYQGHQVKEKFVGCRRIQPLQAFDHLPINF